jgi:ABC-type Mn2+/Zn2+ transport system ATPase subunit
MSTVNTVITLRDVAAAYRREEVLRGVSLDIQQGEFVGVIGPNGAGKTTLLTVINGLIRPHHGQVQVFGAPVSPRNAGNLRKRIGYVIQGQAIDPRLPISVRESALVGSYGRIGLLRRIPQAVYARVDDMLATVGVSHLKHRPLGQLSGGEKQRVAIARALVQEPDILLLDEPTTSLDLQSQRGILDLIHRLHDRFQLTTLMVTHDLNTLPASCQRLVLLKQGRIVWQGAADAALDEHRLSDLYGTRVSIVRHQERPHLIF